MDGTNHHPAPTIAIIGGGFTGACLALHLARAAPARPILVFEPRPRLGHGLAYSTTDPAHRLNARAQRMSPYPDDQAHFHRWLLATGACADDAEAALPDGRLFPRRAVYGAYVNAELAPLLAAGRIRHVQAEVEDLQPDGAAWRLHCAPARCFPADIAILATGHPPPAPPPVLAPAAGHPAFIADPWRPGALAAIAPQAEILIVGTGLTMADAVASLDQAGHRGRILAISRRGQLPREHAANDVPHPAGFPPPATAGALLREVRRAAARAEAAGIAWQNLFDSLRWRAEEFWAPLPDAERRRLRRHAGPFWDTHRHRLPPPTAAIIRRRLTDQTLRVTPARLAAAAPAGSKIDISLRPRGATAPLTERFDAVILTAGPGRLADAPNPLLKTLLAAGLLSLDPTAQGIACDARFAAAGAPPMFIAGPLARGRLAEIIGVPEIARQSAQLAATIATLTTQRP